MWNYSSGKLIFLCKRGLIWGDNRQTILDKTDVVANFVNQWKPLLSTPPKKFEPGKWLLSVHPPFSVPPAISVEAAASQESPGLMLCSYSFSRLYPLRIYLTCARRPSLTHKENLQTLSSTEVSVFLCYVWAVWGSDGRRGCHTAFWELNKFLFSVQNACMHVDS